MKITLLIIAFIGNVTGVFAQTRRDVFTPFTNGLIYDDTTISRLRPIVDSLHARYKNGNCNRAYYSPLQGIGYTIEVGGRKAKRAFKDIQRQISLERFVKKYRQAIIDSNVLIALSEISYPNYKQLHYTALPKDNAIGLDADKADEPHKVFYHLAGRSGKWVYRYSEGDLRAFYIETPLKASKLPERYAARLRYADCMMDTTTDSYLPGAKDEPGFSLKPKKYGPQYDSFVQYILDSLGHTADLKYLEPGSGFSLKIEGQLSSRPSFHKLFSAAVEEALQFTYTTDYWFETTTEKYYSKEAALALIRGRYVESICGTSGLPPARTILIAQLAAETTNLPVMMHSHLSLMNDNIINNTWYRGKRIQPTYIKELEDLGLHVHDLMLSVCFNISNPPLNHFFGNADRLGRALANAKDRNKIEQEMLSMIADNELDDCNRLQMHKLFVNYIFWLNKREYQLAALTKLEDADKTLPSYINSRLKINKAELIRLGDEE